ncbi:hypothetical protein LPJ53_004180 [Coemansia erecta]|uniref:Mitochondrial potassium channel ATP-binding subunit n=1 Tax=Coemansia erecta TaxID=147472 RepID=A0A9W8CQ28_9FUNG|nr:hypothetical protein LPJ53_004180 [Coemansia erecta]
MQLILALRTPCAGRRLTSLAHAALRSPAPATRRAFTQQSGERRQQGGQHRRAHRSSALAGMLAPAGIVGGIAVFLYSRRASGVYGEAAVASAGLGLDGGRTAAAAASARLKILHAQSWAEARQREGGRKTEAEAEAEAEREVSLARQLVRLLAPEAWLLLGVALTAVGGAVVSLWMPVVTGDLINVIARSIRTAASALDDTQLLDALRSPARRLLLLFVANGLLTFAHTTLVTVLGERVGGRLHMQALRALLHHDLGFFDRARSGELVARVTADVGEFTSTFKRLVTQGVKASVLALGVGVQLVRISPALTLALAASMPAAYAALALYGRRLRGMRREALRWDALCAGVAGEAVAGVRTVRALGAEQAELELYAEARMEAGAAASRFGMHMGAFRGLTNVAIGGMVLTVLHSGGRLVARGELAAGDLMAYMLATQAAQRALDALGGLMGQAVKARAAVGRVLEITQLPPATPAGGVRLSEVRGHVRFMDVDFAYPSRPDARVLRRFNLDVPAGQVVALCGASGAGKSTVASLVERFYEPSAGEIWLDACPLKRLDAGWLRGQIGFIPQEPVLFSTTIRENLRMARPSATDAQIEEACRLANAHAFIGEFSAGYDTVVGERGALLSGGQKQRLSIARAILRDPRILVLDEATSSLDAESERAVQAALDRLMVGRTVLVIAHRLSTIRNADRIVVMGDVPGHIVEQGSHEELLARKGAYYRLYTDAKPEQKVGVN